jgi:hypothetical protein
MIAKVDDRFRKKIMLKLYALPTGMATKRVP